MKTGRSFNAIDKIQVSCISYLTFTSDLIGIILTVLHRQNRLKSKSRQPRAVASSMGTGRLLK